jgi:tungstate transport system substrate-binding protein
VIRRYFNPYGVIAVNPAKSTTINADLATKFIDWIISVPVQEKIGEFGKDKFGKAFSHLIRHYGKPNKSMN